MAWLWFRQRKNIAVLHTHMPYTTALCLIENDTLWPGRQTKVLGEWLETVLLLVLLGPARCLTSLVFMFFLELVEGKPAGTPVYLGRRTHGLSWSFPIEFSWKQPIDYSQGFWVFNSSGGIPAWPCSRTLCQTIGGIFIDVFSKTLLQNNPAFWLCKCTCMYTHTHTHARTHTHTHIYICV